MTKNGIYIYKTRKAACLHFIRRLGLVIGILAGFLISSPDSHSAVRAQEFIELSRKSNQALLEEGISLIDRDTLIDRAATCMTIIANNYYQNQTDPEIRRVAVMALRHLGNIYMGNIIDYRQAYRNLVTAKEIAEEDKNDFELANIYVSLSNLYNVNAGNNPELEAESMDYLKRGFRKAVETRNEIALVKIAFNLAVTAMISENPDSEHLKILDEISGYEFSAGNKEKDLTVTVVNAVKAHVAKEYDKAYRLFSEASRMPVYGRYPSRTRYMVDLMLIDHCLAMKEYPKAIALLREGVSLTAARKHTDYELNYLARLVNTYEATGERDSANAYYAMYSNVAEAFQKEKGYKSIESMDFASEIEKINAQVADLSVLRQKERRQYIVVLSALIILVLLTGAFIVVHFVRKRNRRLLFQNQEEMVRREQDLKLLKTQMPQPSSPAKEDNRDKENETPAAQADERAGLVADFARILNVMENSEEIYRTGFSIAELATMVGISQRTASKAINVCRNCNFHQLLNEYRMRKVMRLMSGNLSENYTIEWIAEKAGFKSRTYFTGLFKKSTGLTPSEYLKMARETREKTQQNGNM